MVEVIVLALSNLLFGVAILTYFYLREVKHREDQSEVLKKTHDFYKEVSLSKDELVQEMSMKKDELVGDTFNAFLKHIQSLEKQLSAPKAPDAFVEHVMRGDKVEFVAQPNDIEKTEEEEKEEDFADILRRIPLDHNTKVVREGSELPEEII